MPRDNRTEPRAQGPGIGRQMGRGEGRGRDVRTNLGGYCICLNCGTRVPHQPGISCFKIRCPKCGSPMTQELSLTSQ